MNLPAGLTGARAFWFSMAMAIVLPGYLVAQVRLEQATYIGGADFDRAQGCTIDDNGFIYITGNTKSANLPVTTGVAFAGNTDAFVAKLSPDLKQLVALTYLGGTGEDRGYGVAVDDSGNVYLSGVTLSSVFPTSNNAFDRTRDGSADVFLAKFSPDLRTLLFSTLLGGSSSSNKDSDWTRGGIQLDSQNNIYLAGATAGLNDFPTTPGAFATTYAGGLHDAFLTKFISDGSGLQWSTLIGGATGEENFYGNLILHSDGSVFAAGFTNSTDFPVTPGAYDSNLDGNGYQWFNGEGAIARFNADGSDLLYSTYLWGPVSGNDGLAVDSSGRAHVNTIVTQSQAAKVPVSGGAAQTSFGGVRDMGLAILAADGSRVERASFLGGKGDEEGSGIDLDSAGNIYVGGNTSSTDFPVIGGGSVVQLASGGGRDAFFSVFDQQLALLYSTYMGGSGEDRTRCIASGPNNKVVISGDTDGGFPGVVGGYDAFHNGSRDGFIALFSGVQEGGGGNTTAVDIIGTIKTASGSDVCAMVLASGQFMFSCNPNGVFSLPDLPREPGGTVKRQIYADGFFPKIDILAESNNDAVVMTRSGTCPSYNTSYDPAIVPGSAGKRINIAGKVLAQNSQTPICSMVLANGQHMFSCDGTGSYALNIPLDNNGQFKLQVYADGFAPTIQIFDEFKTKNNVRLATAVECQAP